MVLALKVFRDVSVRLFELFFEEHLHSIAVDTRAFVVLV